MIQVAKRRRLYAYQNMILVQAETAGIFATSLKYLCSGDGSQEEVPEANFQQICEAKDMCRVPMISFNAFKLQSNATLFVKRVSLTKDF